MAKRCAERNGLNQTLGRRPKLKLVLGIVSVSDQISTGDSTHAHDALHPCDECLKMIHQGMEEGFISPDTVMLNVNTSRFDKKGRPIREKTTVDKILRLYKKAA